MSPAVFALAAAEVSAVTKVYPGSVRVARTGFAGGVTEVQVVTVTANASVPATAAGQVRASCPVHGFP